MMDVKVLRSGGLCRLYISIQTVTKLVSNDERFSTLYNILNSFHKT